MSEILPVPTGSSSSRSFLLNVRSVVRNLFALLGFEQESKSHQGGAEKSMIRTYHSWGIFPSLPRDYIRRRRVIRRISNVVLVVLLSVAVAYAIVHISGPAAFSAPHR